MAALTRIGLLFLEGAGLGLLAYGAWLVAPWLGYVVGGLSLVGAAVVCEGALIRRRAG